MATDLFDDLVFPGVLDKTEIQTNMAHVYANTSLQGDHSNKPYAYLYVLLEQMLKGAYDSKHLYVYSDVIAANQCSEFVNLLNIYGMPFSASGAKVTLTKKNVVVEFASYNAVETDAFEFFEASYVYAGFDYIRESQHSLNKIKPYLEKARGFGGKLVGFCPPSSIASISSGVEKAGEMRKNNGIIEVYDGDDWVSLEP